MALATVVKANLDPSERELTKHSRLAIELSSRFHHLAGIETCLECPVLLHFEHNSMHTYALFLTCFILPNDATSYTFTACIQRPVV